MKKRLMITILGAALLVSCFSAVVSAIKPDDTTTAQKTVTAAPQKFENQNNETQSSAASVTSQAYSQAMVERAAPDTSISLDSPEVGNVNKKINQEWLDLRDQFIEEITKNGEYDKEGIDKEIQQRIERNETWEKDYTDMAQYYLDQGDAKQYDALMNKAKNPPVINEDELREKIISSRINMAASAKADQAKMDKIIEITKRAGYGVLNSDNEYLSGEDVCNNSDYEPEFIIACCNTYNDTNADLSFEEKVRIYDYLYRMAESDCELHSRSEKLKTAVDFITRTIYVPESLIY